MNFSKNELVSFFSLSLLTKIIFKKSFMYDTLIYDNFIMTEYIG